MARSHVVNRPKQITGFGVQSHSSEEQLLRGIFGDENANSSDQPSKVHVKFSLTNVVFFDGLGYISRADECRFLSPESLRSKATALDSMRLSPE